jgi:hypothetical protein
MRKILIGAAMVLAISSPAAGDTDVEAVYGDAFYAECSQAPNRTTCGGYIAGVLEGWNLAALNYSELMRVCLPADKTVDQAFDVVMDYLRDRPEHRHWARSALVLIAISERWPCDRSAE